jgi:KaiC/GvpD/RAD55 family RecA-like ATPase
MTPVQALQRLAAVGWRHIVLSNHVPELASIVAGVGLGYLVETVLSSARTGYEKPHPEAFAIAGGPGTDKSLLAPHIVAAAARRGERCAHVTATGELFGRIRGQYGNLGFLTSPGIIDEVAVVDLQLQPRGWSLSDLFEVVVGKMRDTRAKVVAIDSFSTIVESRGRVGIQRFVAELGEQVIATDSLVVLVGDYAFPQNRDLPEIATASLVLYLDSERQPGTYLRSTRLYARGSTARSADPLPFTITGNGIELHA